MKLFKVLSMVAICLQLLPFYTAAEILIGSHVPVILGYLAVLGLVAAFESISFEFEDNNLVQFKHWIAAYLVISIGVVPTLMYLFDVGPSKAFVSTFVCSLATFALGLKIVLRNAAEAEFDAEAAVAAKDDLID